MGNRKMSDANRIKMICASRKTDENNLYKKAKMLLEVYRDVCWNTLEYADEVKETMFYEYELASEDLSSALIYLDNFAPEETRERFAEKIRGLFEVKWMVDIVDAAMRKVRDFPLSGNVYATIISQCYLSRFPFTEAEMLEELQIERSTYYRKKKEAIKVFGLSIWGGHMDEYRQLFMGDEPRQISFFETAI